MAAFSTATLPLALVLLAVASCTSSRTLKLVNLVYRHGARAPFYVYPTDPITWDFWTRGPEQLTTKGMQQQYALGTFLWQRYMNGTNTAILDKTQYLPSDLTVRSSDTDRTLMSAQVNLAALLPPHGVEMWKKDLMWQPIPVHTIPKEQDALLRQYMYNCSEWQKLYDQYMEGDEYKNMVAKYADFVDYIGNKTGIPDFPFEGVEEIHDTLMCEMGDNLTHAMPDWTKEAGVFENLTDITNFLIYSAYSTPEMIRLRGGVILGQFVENMVNKTEGTLVPYNTTKMLMYSAHDVTITGLLVSMNLSDGRIPPFAACVMVELYEETDGSYTVEIHYRNGTDPEDMSQVPFKLTVPGCSAFQCPLSEFLHLVKGAYPDDIIKECTNETPQIFRIALIAGVSAVLAVVILTTITCICCKLRKKNPYARALDDDYTTA
ncbi:prostatic acid phosphatase-like [Glandiceps talaboti]